MSIPAVSPCRILPIALVAFVSACGGGDARDAAPTRPADAAVWFADAIDSAGIARRCTHGTDETDFDLDGHEDLYMAGGHVTSRIEARYPRSAYRQRNLLFLNDGAGHFAEVGANEGPGLASVLSSRGAAGGDYDNDGDVDIAVVNKNGPLQLLRNDSTRRGNWLRVVLVARESAPDGIDARATVVAEGRRIAREVRAGSSYGATKDIRPLFGLGSTARSNSVNVAWPRGIVDRLANVAANATVRITEGETHAPTDRP